MVMIYRCFINLFPVLKVYDIYPIECMNNLPSHVKTQLNREMVFSYRDVLGAVRRVMSV